MASQAGLKVLGTLLFLLGAFGYLYPQVGKVVFTNNENLFHVLAGLASLALAQFSPTVRRTSLVVLALGFLALGIYGLTLKNPTDLKIKRLTAQLDPFDNATHVAFGLALAWVWFGHRKS